MAKLIWDRDGERLYETGVCHVVLYPKQTVTTPFGTVVSRYGPGVAWNGVTSISVSPSGGEPQAVWADDAKYLNLLSAEELNLTIEAYTYPDEFRECDGSREIVEGMHIFRQKRKEFALSFETKVGNDQKGTAYGRKLHLVFGCLAAPAERSNQTISDSPEAMTMSWSVTTSPKTMANGKNVSYMVIDSTKTPGSSFLDAERILHGGDETIDGYIFEDFGFEPELPYPDDMARYLAGAEANAAAGRSRERYSFVWSTGDGQIAAIRDDVTGRYLYTA